MHGVVPLLATTLVVALAMAKVGALHSNPELLPTGSLVHAATCTKVRF